jgi:hypothetical protein
MSSAFLEIVELEGGGFALKRMDEEGEFLVEIQFSDEVENFLGEHKAAIAKAMIGAGVQAAGSLSRSAVEAEEKEREERVLH